MTDKPAAAGGAAKPQFTKPSRLIAAAKAGEDNLVEEYLSDKSKNIDVNKVSPPNTRSLSLFPQHHSTTSAVSISRG
jgi:hypothetical protein